MSRVPQRGQYHYRQAQEVGGEPRMHAESVPFNSRRQRPRKTPKTTKATLKGSDFDAGSSTSSGSDLFLIEDPWALPGGY
jgi:hypothetical protein